MLRRTCLSAICIALLAVGIGYTQPSATITLKSGQVITGDLVALGTSGYAVRVNGKTRNISQDDVAVIDFTGALMSNTEWEGFRDKPEVVLRSGQTIEGRVSGIIGTSPLNLTVQTSDGTQELSSSDVARIVMARPANAPVATTGVNPQVTGSSSVAGSVTVLANQAWSPTALTVQKGEQLHFTASGTIQLSRDRTDIAEPDGSKTGRRPSINGFPAGELIAKVGTNGRSFPIGRGGLITMPDAGQLFLGVNDDGFSDNGGTFQVSITRQ